jgi:undecaprenyl-diphosphatase
MLGIVHHLSALDLSLTHETAELRWGPTTALFTLASAWWVKGGLLLALGGASDVARGRRRPVALLTAIAAFLVASLVSALAKLAFERPRPPLADSDIRPAIDLPDSWSFPSGHATTAFAAAAAIAVLCPRARWPALALAALIAVSRVFLGVHFWLDVIAGTLLGVALGVAVATTVRRRAATVAP